jgi:hypothetical protein
VYQPRRLNKTAVWRREVSALAGGALRGTGALGLWAAVSLPPLAARCRLRQASGERRAEHTDRRLDRVCGLDRCAAAAGCQSGGAAERSFGRRRRRSQRATAAAAPAPGLAPDDRGVGARFHRIAEGGADGGPGEPLGHEATAQCRGAPAPAADGQVALNTGAGDDNGTGKI